MEYSQILINRILQLCDEKNITINRLANLSEIQVSVLDKIIKGKTLNPGIVTIQCIALGFNMSLSEFLDFDEMNQVTFPLIRKFKKKRE